MSIELQTAFERDDALLNEDGSFEYVDNSVVDESGPNDSTIVETTATVVEDKVDEKHLHSKKRGDIFDQVINGQG